MSAPSNNTNYLQENRIQEQQLARSARNYMVEKVYNILNRRRKSAEVAELHAFLNSTYLQLRDITTKVNYAT